MGSRASLDCVLLVNTATYGAPAWEEVKNCRNPGVSKAKTMAEVTTRRHGGMKAFLGTLKEFGLEFEMNADDSDQHYVRFEDSFWNGTQLDLLVLRNLVGGARKGVRLQMEVETFEEKQDQESQVITTVKLVIRDPEDNTTPVVERYTYNPA